jgi:spore coat protein U-like protein
MIRKLILGAFLLLSATAAEAALTCNPTSSGIAFGTFSGSQITIVGSIALNCVGSSGSSYTLTLSTGGSGSFSTRKVKNGATTLSYNLYSDAAFTQIWGDGSAGTSVSNGSPVTSVSVYAKLPSQTKPAPGTYTDTITASLTVGGTVTTTTFPVTVRVDPNCAISATNLAFGTYSGSQLDGQSSISVNCTSGSPWTIGLNSGTFASATVTSRKLTGPGATPLAYSLFRDSARTLNWGNTVGTDTVAGTGTGAAQAVNVYGRIGGSQSVGGGGYTDTVIATLTF